METVNTHTRPLGHVQLHPNPQVQRNVGHGAITIDEYFYSSIEHVGLCNIACNLAVDPPLPLHLHPCAQYYAGHPALALGDPCQHKQPKGTPVYGGAAKYLEDIGHNPLLRPMRAPPTRQPLNTTPAQPANAAPPPQPSPTDATAAGPADQPHTAPNATPTTPAAHPDRQQQRPQQQEQRTAQPRPVQTTPDNNETLKTAGFTCFRGFEDTIILSKQQRQNNSASGKKLQKMASLFNGTHGFNTSTEAGKQQLTREVDSTVTDLNRRAVTTLHSLEPEGKRVRVVVLNNDVRHLINKTCIFMDAKRMGKRITMWNARHQRTGPNKQQGLSPLENYCAMRVRDKEFDHFTADTYVFEGCLMTLLITNANAGAARNMVVRVLGIITHPDEPEDDGTGPYRRLTYLPKGVIVEHVTGAATAEFLKDEKEFEGLPAGAFVVRPETSNNTATLKVPDENGVTHTATVKRINVPLGDAYCVTDYFVQASATLSTRKGIIA